MSALLPLSAAASSAGTYAGVVPVAALVALVILLFEKQVTATVSSTHLGRLSRFIDVALAPLAMTALAVGAHELAIVMGWW